MSALNLRDIAVHGHWDCWGYANPMPKRRGDTPRHRAVGDLRYCDHGVIQVVIDFPRSRMQGPGTWRWADLPKRWNWKQWHAAKALLDTPPTVPNNTP